MKYCATLSTVISAPWSVRPLVTLFVRPSEMSRMWHFREKNCARFARSTLRVDDPQQSMPLPPSSSSSILLLVCFSLCQYMSTFSIPSFFPWSNILKKIRFSLSTQNINFDELIEQIPRLSFNLIWFGSFVGSLLYFTNSRAYQICLETETKNITGNYHLSLDTMSGNNKKDVLKEFAYLILWINRDWATEIYTIN